MNGRGLLVMLLLWTAFVLVITLVWPFTVQTPGCAHHVQPSADCATLMDAMNEQNWWSTTVPLLAVVFGGYALVLASWVLVRRHR